MRDKSQRVENREICERCQRIDSLLRGDEIIRGYDIQVQGKRAYVGLPYRINEFIKREQETTRHAIIEEMMVEGGVIKAAVKKLLSDGTIIEEYKKSAYYILKPAG